MIPTAGLGFPADRNPPVLNRADPNPTALQTQTSYTVGDHYGGGGNSSGERQQRRRTATAAANSDSGGGGNSGGGKQG
jgi:hypothetical protein